MKSRIRRSVTIRTFPGSHMWNCASNFREVHQFRGEYDEDTASVLQGEIAMRWILCTTWALWLAAQAPAQTAGQIMATGNGPPRHELLAPGQVTTLFVYGVNVADATAAGVPLPVTLSGLSVLVSSSIPGYPQRLPIFSIRSFGGCGSTVCDLTFVTVQIPIEPTCVPMTGFPNECTMAGSPAIQLTVEHNGRRGPSYTVAVGGMKPHFLNSCDTVFGTFGGICYSFVTHSDGKPVTGVNPARAGETIVASALLKS